MSFDYVGAPWKWCVGLEPKAIIGNGGFSLRNVKWMRHICENYVTDPRFAERGSGGEPEDVFFARHLVKYAGARLPSYDVACEFSTEHNISQDPMGFHQVYKFQSPQYVSRLMSTDHLEYNAQHLDLACISSYAENERKLLRLGINGYGSKLNP